MKTSLPFSGVIQKYPVWKALSVDHPCVNNLRPVYIDKFDHNVKINSRPLLITSILLREELLRKLEPPMVEIQESPIELPITPNLPRLVEKSISNQFVMNLPTNNNQKGRKTFFNALEMLHRETTENPALVENLVPKKEITVIAGKGDTGKSLLYLNLSLSIILKQDSFIGFKIFSNYSSVLIISTEDGESVLKDRIQRQALCITGQTIEQLKENDLLKNLYIRVVQENLFDFINETLQKNKVDLLVLDALGDIIEGDENSQKDVRLYYDKLYSVIANHDCAILIVAHENKAAGKKSNRNNVIGSTAIVDRARSVLMLARDQKDSKARILTIVKANYISDELKGKPIKLTLNDETITYMRAKDYVVTMEIDSENSLAAEISKKLQLKKSPSNSVTLKSRKNKPGRKRDEVKFEAAHRMNEQGFPQVEISKILGVNKATICRWLKEKDINLKQAI
jgi:RecA-family ATPase